VAAQPVVVVVQDILLLPMPSTSSKLRLGSTPMQVLECLDRENKKGIRGIHNVQLHDKVKWAERMQHVAAHLPLLYAYGYMAIYHYCQMGKPAAVITARVLIVGIQWGIMCGSFDDLQKE